MNVYKASIPHAEAISQIVKEANIPVAELIGLTNENCPKHPSNCSKDWILESMDNGEEYYLLETEGSYVGCVAYQDPETETSYLNRLAVLPEYQNKGYGQELVSYHEKLSKDNNKVSVSIGIIDSNIKLKEWYKKLGYIENGKKEFPHLPFTVCYMIKKLAV